MTIPILIAIVLFVFLLLRKKQLFLVGLILLFLINVFRDESVGTDYYNNIELFKIIDKIDADYSNFFTNTFFTKSERTSREFVWNGLNLFVKNIGGDYFIVNAFSIFLILMLYYITFKRVSNNPLLSLFLFFMLFIYFQTFNTTRQSISIALFIFSLYYLQYDKKLIFFVLILLATTLHSSAIFLLPLYFIKNIHLKNKTVFLLVVFSFIIPYIHLEEFVLKLFSLDFMYQKYFELISNPNIYGYILLYSNLIIQTMFFIYSKAKCNIKTLYVNIWFIGIVLQNITINYIYLNRFADYFMASQIVAIPIIYGNIKDVNRKNNYFIFSIIYSILIFSLRLLANNQGVIPYTFK